MDNISHQSEYEQILKRELLLRFRVIAGSGSIVYALFTILDKVVYPTHFDLFLKIRIFGSLFLFGLFIISKFQFVKDHVREFIDAMIIVTAGSLVLMVWLADGAWSDYYQGVSLVLLANFAANSFDVRHNLFAGGTVFVLYQFAVAFNPAGIVMERVIPANFFMGTTLFFVALLTSLFRRQHYADFQKTKELEKAYAKLRETEVLKSEFFSNVSHELRTPLSLILAPVESLLADTSSCSTKNESLKIIHNNALRLLGMITGLLDFSKLDAGKMRASREPLHLENELRSILKDFSPLLESKKLTLAVLIKLQNPVREMDRYMFERIVTNLLSNASKFTPAHGTIVVRMYSDADNRVILEVEDNGIGIASADLEKLFQRFRQIEGASVRRFEGTGLGLALVKELCEILKGSVSVKSTREKGSVFTVNLFCPVSEKSPGSTPRVNFIPRFVDPILEKTPRSVPREIKILIAEDNSELASYLSQVIGDVYSVRIATDGEEAWKLVNSWIPDIVLADVMMPKMDGFEVCRRIKTDEKLSMTPVILLTALTHRDALLKGWNAGADEYLFKPFHPLELMTRLRSIVIALKNRKNHEQQLQAQSALIARKNTELEQLSVFQYVASHHFQEPLHQMISQLKDLRREMTGSTLESSELKAIEEAGARLQCLLEAAREFALAGRPVSPQKVDLNKTIHAVQEKLKPELKGATLRYGSLPPVLAEENDMFLLFSHLISNALKYRQVGVSPEIRIQSKIIGEICEISITDNGIGFDGAYSEKIFEPFRRLHAANEYGGGAGIGLAISKKLLLKYGGAIEGISTGGHGSQFVVKLPSTQSSQTNYETEVGNC